MGFSKSETELEVSENSTEYYSAVELLHSFLRAMELWEDWAAANDPDPDLTGIDVTDFLAKASRKLKHIFEDFCANSEDRFIERLNTLAYQQPSEYAQDSVELCGVTVDESDHMYKIYLRFRNSLTHDGCVRFALLKSDDRLMIARKEFFEIDRYVEDSF